MTLNQLFNLSVPQFPHMPLRADSWIITSYNSVTHLTQLLAKVSPK